MPSRASKAPLGLAVVSTSPFTAHGLLAALSQSQLASTSAGKASPPCLFLSPGQTELCPDNCASLPPEKPPQAEQGLVTRQLKTAGRFFRAAQAAKPAGTQHGLWRTPGLPGCPPLATVAGQHSAGIPRHLSASSNEGSLHPPQNPLLEFQRLVDLSRNLEATPGTPGDPLPIADAQRLFQNLSTAELANALLNLELAASATVVDAATLLLSSRAVQKWHSTVGAPVLWAVKRTAHSHFCAGETVEEACSTLERMWALGLKGILDFSVEDALDEATCDRNLEGFLRTIRHTASMPAGSVSYACVKLTALCPLPVLERASAQIRLHQMSPDQPQPSWMLPSLPALADASPRLTKPQAVAARSSPMTGADISMWENTYSRLRKICAACEEQRLPLLIDAEYQSVEPAIDHLAYAAAVEFNRPGKPPLVYATVQCYLRDALPRLERSFQEAQRRGVPFGVKLVRGAYLARESELARAAGVPSPLFESIQATHECYDTCAALMIGAAAQGAKDPSRIQAGVVLATHNYGSGRKAVLCASEAGLDRKDPRLQFAQLKGMADGLSLTLALSGFNASKYLPYGKVEEVMPYLLRRAQENRGVLGNTRDERVRLRSELKRRFLSWIGVA